MLIKVWAVVNHEFDRRFYTLYEFKDCPETRTYCYGYDVIELPEGYELKQSVTTEPYIYHNDFAYKIHKLKSKYYLYPAELNYLEALANKKYLRTINVRVLNKDELNKRENEIVEFSF